MFININDAVNYDSRVHVFSKRTGKKVWTFSTESRLDFVLETVESLKLDRDFDVVLDIRERS